MTDSNLKKAIELHKRIDVKKYDLRTIRTVRDYNNKDNQVTSVHLNLYYQSGGTENISVTTNKKILRKICNIIQEKEERMLQILEKEFEEL